MRKCARCSSNALSRIESRVATNAGWTCSQCGLRMRHSQSVATPVIAVGLGLLIGAPLAIGTVSDLSSGNLQNGYVKPWGVAVCLIVIIWGIRQFRMPAPKVTDDEAQAENEPSPYSLHTKTATDENYSTNPNSADESPDDSLRQL